MKLSVVFLQGRRPPLPCSAQNVCCFVQCSQSARKAGGYPPPRARRRKTIAEKNLEQEAANLARVEDILAELEKQVGPLEKQSEKAREYLKYKEEYTGIKKKLLDIL